MHPGQGAGGRTVPLSSVPAMNAGSINWSFANPTDSQGDFARAMSQITCDPSATAQDLWKYSPLFRSPKQIEALKRFLVEDPMKEHVLEEFATGFISHFEYTPPEP